MLNYFDIRGAAGSPLCKPMKGLPLSKCRWRRSEWGDSWEREANGRKGRRQNWLAYKINEKCFLNKTFKKTRFEDTLDVHLSITTIQKIMKNLSHAFRF